MLKTLIKLLVVFINPKFQIVSLLFKKITKNTMNLNLTKPIVFFDLETTGINIANDRIVEISILKIYPNGTEESKTWLVNPVIEIPKEASDIHGITNEKVLNENSLIKEK